MRNKRLDRIKSARQVGFGKANKLVKSKARR